MSRIPDLRSQTAQCPRRPFAAVALLLLSAALAAAAEPQGVTAVIAQPAHPTTASFTGRVQATVSARIGPRVSAKLNQLGKSADGRPLDAGMTVMQGDVLFVLDPTTFENAKAVAEAAVHSAQANLDNLIAHTRPERIAQLKASVDEFDARIADKVREEIRFKRLVEEDRTLPPRRLEELQTELAAMRAQHAAAAARLAESEAGATKTERAIAEAAVKQAQAALTVAQSDLRDATVTAPFAGLITKRFKSPGDYLVNMPPTDVFELVSNDSLEAELNLPEAYMNAIEEGRTTAVLRSPLLKAPRPLPIARIIRDVDSARGTFAIRVTIPADARDGLAPGAFITADVELASRDMPVLIPIRALITHEGKPAVLVAEGNKVARRAVELGDRMTEGVIVRSGLKPGEKILIAPAGTLQDGDAVPGYLGGKPATAPAASATQQHGRAATVENAVTTTDTGHSERSEQSEI